MIQLNIELLGNTGDAVVGALSTSDKVRLVNNYFADSTIMVAFVRSHVLFIQGFQFPISFDCFSFVTDLLRVYD